VSAGATARSLVRRVLGRTARPAQDASFEIEHEGVRHVIRLKRVAAARRYTLRVRMARGDIVLTMPLRASAEAARDFARRHAAWVARRVGQLHQPVAFAPGALVPFRGVPHRLVAAPGVRRRAWAETAAPTGPEACLHVSGPPSAFAETLHHFLREEARRALTEAAERHAARAGRRIAGLTLRDTKSRWGSCTAQGRLNFSWRLILAPPGVLDYLAAHEVAHLVHMNHSDRFWALARELAPQIDEAEAWLKQNGARLHHYGVPAGGVTPDGRSG
jgi:predicted metal-dependent hydrolase